LAAGHDVLVSAYGWPQDASALVEMEKAGAKIDRRRIDRTWRRSALRNALIDPFRKLKEFSPQAVLVNQGGTYDISLGAEMKVLKKALVASQGWPYVMLCHCEQALPQRPRTQQRAREAFERAAVLGMLSNNLREKSERELGVRLPNTRLFQNPLNIRESAIVPWPDDSLLRMAFVGRLEPIKGMHTLLDALGDGAWPKREWRLSVFGDGPQRQALEAQACGLGIADKIVFRGFVNGIEAVWREHHVFVLPSTQEGVPNAMLEAMLSGRPVLVTQVGGIREWVDDEINGFVAARSDRHELGLALERMWSRREQLKAVGIKAFDSTSEHRDADPPRTVLRWLEEIAIRR
ncbi:MAG TPA: glycosyltransferase family 4 protein, partial [Steroidobacteraceae bacterium]|nr:glycosyltransferase family 4 protein [Steroidobacteraceae bacterium]